MPAPPNPVLIFHITAITNLQSIVARGSIEATALLAAAGVTYSNIAYQGAQSHRSIKVVTKPPGGVIHDYVPFYFAPRSPMLFTINNGNVPGCAHRQPDIVHFVTNVNAVCQAGLPWVFYNYNATLGFAQCFDDLADLVKIDWPLFFEAPKIGGYCRYWHSRIDTPKYALRMETRQAEFLIHQRVPLDIFESVAAYDATKATQVQSILLAGGCNLPVKAVPDWYY